MQDNYQDSGDRPPKWPLEPDEATVRTWLTQATDLLIEHLESLSRQPAAAAGDVTDADLRALIEPVPEAGTESGALFSSLIREHVPRSLNTAGPGYLAYIPGGGIVSAAIADLIADITNRYVGVFAAAPLLARLEITVVRWFLDSFGFPPEARGVLTSGGSIANLIALVCARYDRLGEHFQDGVVLVSDQAHHSLEKAARFVGFPSKSLCVVPTGDDLRLDPDRVRQALETARADGMRPAILIASAGTTNTGVVDDLTGLARVAADEDLWFHVDAAYGGFFQWTERGRQRLRGIDRADSITVDPHKGLFLPYGTGCLLVRDGARLRAPQLSATDYLPPLRDDDLVQDFCEYSPELSRDFRGLRVWLSLKLFGARAFRDCLDEKLDLAQHAASELRSVPGIEVLAEPDLSLVAFRAQRGASPESLAEENRFNQELLERVLAHNQVWMSGAFVKGRFTQRICVLSFRTHRPHVDRALRLFRREMGA